MKLSPVRAAVLASAVVLATAPAALATSAINQTAVTNGLDYLGTQQTTTGDITGFSGINPWAAMAYAAAGTDPAAVKTSGGQSLEQYLLAHPPAAAAAATEWERDILAITAMGQNPYGFGGANYVAGLEALHHDHQIGSTTAVNDDFFGVAALLAAHTPVTDPALTDALAFVLAHQHSDGGFSYSTDSGTGSDVDDTAAALMGVEVAEDAGMSVPTTDITKAKTYMLGTQNADGGFPYDPLTPPAWGGPVSNVSSSAWVLMSLTALGDGSTSNATNAAAYIRSAQQPDGSFPYTAPGAGDTFDTAYAVMALADGFWPLHVYDGPVPAATASASPTPPAGSVLGASTSGTGSGSGSGGSTLPAVGGHQIPAPLAALLVLVALAALWHLSRRPALRS